MKRKKESFAILGCGRFGFNLAVTLSEFGHEVLAVDRNEEIINELGNYVTYAICADIGMEGALNSIGLSNVDCAVIGMSSDFEASIMATAICREKKIPQIIVKSKDERHSTILRQIGATRIVQPEKDMGIRLGHSLSKQSIYEYIELSDEYSIVELKVPDSWLGKSLAELNVRANYDVNIIGIINGSYSNINPSPTDSFRERDHIFILGTAESIMRIEQL